MSNCQRAHRGIRRFSSSVQFNTTDTCVAPPAVGVTGCTIRKRPSIGDTSYGVPDRRGAGLIQSKSFVIDPTDGFGENVIEAAIMTR